MMRIGAAAATTGLTPRALRHYEEEGLLRPRRAPSGHREYGEADLRRLRVIRGLLDAGLTVADVRSLAHVLDEESARFSFGIRREEPEGCAVGEVSLHRLAELDARIEELTALRERLASRIAERFGAVFDTRPYAPGRAA
ncbi:MerR family transcriptional regulator [Streptomyces sp. 8N114]|uniref:MerR family transcriptional regulator n=1 Tax=Streptomyces sp. 8N114 TaxID=3457419 RepID=UPI003FD1BD5E